MPPFLLSWLLDLVPSLLVVTVTAFVLPPRTLFDWHPLLVVVGGMLIMPWAIRALDRDMSWMTHKQRASKIQWHWILQLAGTVCIALGATAVFMNKNFYGKPHFATWHGLMGLITVVFAILVTCAGFGIHWKFWPIGRLVNYGTARATHMYFGLGSILLGGVTTGLGLCSHWFNRQISSRVGERAVLGVTILFFVFALFPALRIMLQVFRIRFRQPAAKPNQF
ncbi:hypothetical protein FGIG_04799 [Fasciola gigantica]|uniref:ascorbate ferrireductase (transmembrane) n=1 Tax=Fasciola gigantica TaxID=46835 RepID=A0A504Z3F2_FASGI|nr:hypothetical protein FGIG_04799 [Fasciola gigantica]